MNYILRMTSNDAAAVRAHFAVNSNVEQFVLLLAERIELPRFHNIFVVRETYFPDHHDLRSQSSAFISPSRRFQLYIYQRAKETGLSVIDIHTHPWSRKRPSFSSIDLGSARKEANFFREKMPKEVGYGLVVANADFTSYSGLTLNKKTGEFDPINIVEILGSPTEILSLDDGVKNKDERYARHYLIGGWKQDALADLKVAVVGAGGNGSHIIQALACMGIGSGNGHIMIIDDEVVQESNLSRIPYAKKSDIGKSKVKVAANYIRSKNLDIKVITRQKSIEDKQVQKAALNNHFIFGCVDSEKARTSLSEIAHKGCIPYLDLASEIIPKEDFSGAQTRLVMPYRGCLFCIGGINTSEAALESLSEETKEIHRKAGYIRGTNESPTPSVIHLNGVIAYISIAVFIRTIFGELVDNQKTIIYNQGKMSLLTATFNRSMNCPLCGEKPSEKELQKDLEELRKNIKQKSSYEIAEKDMERAGKNEV